MHSQSLYINLATAHVRRFEYLGDIDDIQKAIQYYKQASAEPEQGDLQAQSRCLNHLGAAHRARFGRLGDTEDINTAIGYQTQAVRLSSEQDPLKAEWLIGLESSLRARFEYLGNLDDIDSAIDYQQQAVSFKSAGAEAKSLHLAALGASYNARFERTGQLHDLDMAINVQTEAITGISDSNVHRPALHNGLAQSYDFGFRRLGNLEDIIDKAIHHHSLAAKLASEEHISKFWYLTSLGNSLKRRFQKLQDLSDINAAIQNQKHAVFIVPFKHTAKLACFENLGNSYKCRFGILKNVEDVDEAITCHSYAVLFAEEKDSRVAQRLSNLSMSYIARFECSGDREDIDVSIRCQEEAVALTPQNDIKQPTHLGELAEGYWSSYRHYGGLDSMKSALDYYKQAALQPTGDLRHQFQAARSWATLAASHSHLDPLPAYTRAMELVPQVAWLGAPVEQRYEHIVSMRAISAEAAAFACSVGEYDIALEWMEAGRSIVWRQMLQLRTPFDDLAAIDPVLAENLKRVSQELNELSVRSTEDSDMVIDGFSAEWASQRHRRLADEWEDLLAKAKRVLEFNDFLMPKKATELRLAACDGLVVVINVHAARSDALVLRPRSSVIELVHLPQLGIQSANDARACLLEEIDRTQTHLRGDRRPVWTEHDDQKRRDYLGYMQRHLTGKLPHYM
ncbi:hypothetical protein FRC07_002151, partial [Ceratobasidium sp. 392]